MNIFPKPLLNKVWTEKICLLQQQTVNCAVRAQRFSCDAQSGSCLSAENHSQ
jgi:hypothetical protein